MLKRRIMAVLTICLLMAGTTFCGSDSDQRRIQDKRSRISALEERFNKLTTMKQHKLISNHDEMILTQTGILNLINDILKISPSERKNLKEKQRQARENLKLEIGIKNNQIIAFTNEIARLKALTFSAPHLKDLEQMRKHNVNEMNRKIRALKHDINTMKAFLD